MTPTARPFPGHEEGSRAYGRITLSLFLAGVATFASLYSTQPLLPMLAAEFGLSAAGAALSVSAATLGLGAALLVVGPLSEVAGRTRLMHASLLLSALIGLAVPAAPGWPLLITLRAAQGVTLAGLSAVALAYLAEEIAPASQARAAGSYVGGTAIGGMTGRLLTGAVAEWADWHGALVANALLALACALAVRALLPASQGFTPSEADLRVLARRGVQLFRDPVLLALFLIAGTSMGAFVGLFNAIGFRLEAAPYGLSVGVAGLVFLVYAPGSVASARAGRLAGRHGRRTVEPIAAAVYLAGVLLTLASPLPLVVLGLTIVSIGFFAVHGVASGWVTARTASSGGPTGQASAAYLFVYYLGSSVLGGLAGSAWTAGGWAGVVAVSGGAVAVTLACALWLRARA